MSRPAVTGVTIDASHSRDLDDAIWVHRHGDGHLVTVSVSDVAAKVMPGSSEDVAALALGETRYMARAARQPMLPRALSEGGMSLQPGNPGEVLAFRIALGPDLGIRSVETVAALLDHAGRLDHGEAAAIIAGNGSDAVAVMLRHASALAEALLQSRIRAGAIAFSSPADGLLTDEEGRIVDLGGCRGASAAYVLVQELMILANRAVAEDCARNGVQLLYRNHRGNPVADRAALQADLAIAASGGPHAASAVARMSLLSGRAELAPQATGHFSLNLPAYAWVTSPLRRYADLVNHRVLRARMLGEPQPYDPARLQGIADALNVAARERAAERDAHGEAQRLATGRRALVRRDFRRLDDATMHQAIKAAVAGPPPPDGLLEECLVRAEQGSLSSGSLIRLLAATGEGFEEYRLPILERLADYPGRTVALLHEMRQAGRVEDLAFREEPDPVGWAATASATVEGRSLATAPVSAPARKDARDAAAARLIAMAAGIEIPLPSAPATSPLAVAMVAVPPPVVPAAAPAATEANAKGVLLALCQSRGWPVPAFATTVSGPPHAPVFSTVATLAAGGREMSSGETRAATRRDGERLAAAALLAALGGPKAAPASRSGDGDDGDGNGNWKGVLQEICQSRGWPLPDYRTEREGPDHAPVFRSKATVSVPGGASRSATASGGTRKFAERAAAAALSAELGSAPAGITSGG